MLTMILLFVILFFCKIPDSYAGKAVEGLPRKVNTFFSRTMEPIVRHFTCYAHCNQVFGKSFGKELSICARAEKCSKEHVIDSILKHSAEVEIKGTESKNNVNAILSRGYSCLRNCRIKSCYKFLCQTLAHTKSEIVVEGIAYSLKSLKQSWLSTEILGVEETVVDPENMLAMFLAHPKFHHRCMKLFKNHPKQLRYYINNRKVLEKVLGDNPSKKWCPRGESNSHVLADSRF